MIAACFIGGASAYGGVGRVGGAVIGAFIMGVMNNGMSILGIGISITQRPARVQFSPPHSAPMQPSTFSVSGPASETWLT